MALYRNSVLKLEERDIDRLKAIAHSLNKGKRAADPGETWQTVGRYLLIRGLNEVEAAAGKQKGSR